MNGKTVIRFLGLIALVLIVYLFINNKNQREQQKIKYQLESYRQDSTAIFTFDQEETHNINTLNSFYLSIKKSRQNKLYNYQVLSDRLDSLKYIQVYGTYYFDEFSKELLRKKEKRVTLLFVNRTLANTEYKSTKVYKGYKNWKNKKAHRLQKKYNWTNQECLDVVSQKYWIGMSDKMARESLGRPSDINRTRTSRGVSEQWVYRLHDMYMYMYFDNGILTTVQD